MLVLRIEKKQLKFLGYIVRKEELQNLTLTGHIDSKRDRGKFWLMDGIRLEGMVEGLYWEL